jgi:alkyl hydroperoxide reductase subunit AhpC
MHRQVCKAYGIYWPDLNVAGRGTVIIARDGKVKWSQKREIKDAMNFDQVLAQV